MKNIIMRNSIMEFCSILNSLGTCFETFYLMVIVIVEAQFLWTNPWNAIYGMMKKFI
jgi:hypothetical protein